MPTCKGCGEHFPNYVKIDGITHNICSRLYCLKCSPFGAKKNKKTRIDEITEKTCSKCKRTLPIENFYLGGGKRPKYHSYCKECHNKYVKGVVKDKKLRAIMYLGGKCEECGYRKNMAALELHHRDGDEKEAVINRLLYNDWETVIKELDKCDLLCCRCHRELHYPNLDMPQEQ